MLMRSVSTGFSSSFPAPSEQPFGDPVEGWARRSDIVQAMDMDVRIDSLDLSMQRNKRKGSFSDDGGPRVRARTLGGDRPVESHVAREIPSWTAAPKSLADELGTSGQGGGLGRLEAMFAPLPLLTYLSSELEGTNEVLEAKNMESDGTTEIAFVVGKQTEWLDFLPSPAIVVKATSSFCAVAMQDASVNVYSHCGRTLVLFLPRVVKFSDCVAFTQINADIKSKWSMFHHGRIRKCIANYHNTWSTVFMVGRHDILSDLPENRNFTGTSKSKQQTSHLFPSRASVIYRQTLRLSLPQFEIMAFPFSAVPMVLSIPTILPYYPGSNSAIAGGLRDPTSGRAGNVAMAVSQTEAL
jgi:hypothetical protein